VTKRDEEIARRDAIIMNMTETMKALSPPDHADATQEPTDGPTLPLRARLLSRSLRVLRRSV
jgi:hypothetical protein